MEARLHRGQRPLYGVDIIFKDDELFESISASAADDGEKVKRVRKVRFR
jgi:hypothetical protein